MGSRRWFPRNYELTAGRHVGGLLHSGEEWQIYGGQSYPQLLVAKQSLATRWFASKLVAPEQTAEVAFGHDRYHVVCGREDCTLSPVTACHGARTKEDGLAFALSLRDTRRLVPSAPLHDAIYVEQLSRLLPCWTVSLALRDDEILGRWLTGGVGVSAFAVRRLRSLLSWFTEDDIKEIVAAAGLTPAADREPLAQNAKSLQGRETQHGNRSKHIRDERSTSSARKPNRRFHLPGRTALRTFFREHVIEIIENEDRYREFGITFPAGIVLHGPPGCGKTYAVDRLVEYLDWPSFAVGASSIGSPYIHETSRRIADLFDNARQNAPALVVIDEMDAFLASRDAGVGAAVHHLEEVAEFLRCVGEAPTRRVLVVGMTNRLDLIDRAILRRGRFDHVVEVGPPSQAELRELLEFLLESVPCSDEIDVPRLASLLDGRPVSDVAFLVREAARRAVQLRNKQVLPVHLFGVIESLKAERSTPRRFGFTGRCKDDES